MVYYVSERGDDGNGGTGRGPRSALRTVQAAVNLAKPGDTVRLLEGTYRETVVFPRSGTAKAPITLRPVDGAQAVISGCEPVEGWTLHDTGKGIWKAAMPWTLGLGRNQAFCGAEVMIEARHPNVPDPGLGMYVSGLSPLWPTFAELSIPDPTNAPGRVTGALLAGYPADHWKGGMYYGNHYEGWSAQTGVIESSKDGEITVGDRTEAWWFGALWGGRYQPEEGRGMIVGHMNALDCPGEWHWQDGTLYFIPPRGGAPKAVEAKARQLAFDLSGREHIHIVGLEVRAASARLADAAHCTFEGCRFTYVSHYVRHYSTGQVEQGRDTITSGETGIFVGGHDNAFIGSSVRFSAGAGFYLRGYHHTIHNCLIDEVSYVGHYTNAITDAVTDYVDYENFLVGGHVITYNTMRNAGRHFFNIHGNGTSQASRTRGPMDYMATLFAHNHLYNGMLQTKDAGFITGYYCSGGTLDGLSTRIVYNVMHDCYDIFAMRIDVLGIVYLDAGTCNVDLHHNLLWAAPGSLQRGLWYNTMCVAVSEQDNLFHPQFTRSSSTLQPADFPEARPFRFGHDFDDPPSLPEWPQLERVVFPADQRATLVNGSRFQVGEVDFDGSRQSAVMELASDVASLNSDRSARERPRHRKVTDPLVLEAVHGDGRDDRIKEQWTFVYETAGDSWLRFQGVPLGEGYRRFRVVYGNDRAASRKLEVRLDRVDGPLAATVDLPPTDKPRAKRIQIYAEATGEVSAQAAGTRDVYVVFRSGDEAPVGEFEYFRFEGYRGEIALQPTEAKIELRIDSPTGDKIGEFYPRATGGPAVYREMVAPLEAVTGRHRVYAVVRSTIDGSIGTTRCFRFERARMPIDWRGVGDPPQSRNGALVYPEPTNLPCARPGDKYPKKGGAG